MSRTLQPDDQISHYRVVGPLGAGGMGEVYIARDGKLERSVALKILPPRLVRDEERVRRFVTEAKSASGLNHPNIVTIYEIGHDQVRGSDAGGGGEGGSDPVHFISMELVTGDTLTRKIHDEREDLRTLTGYLAQAAEGVAKAHAAGIVHRDLKPANIMISRDGFAKVLDFGLAKLTEKQTGSDEEMTSAPTEGAVTGKGVIMGTVGYMSPEQVKARSVDHRSDIFSLGCILYEAATRRRPFQADTDVETMAQILSARPAPVEELNPEVPSEIRKLIRRCLAKNPEQRFQSMKDVAIELREAVEEWDSLSASATSASSAGSLASGALGVAPGLSTGTKIAIASVAVLGIAGLGLGLYSLMGGPAEPPADPAGIQDLQISLLMSRDDFAGNRPGAPADAGVAVLSADGRYLAYAPNVGESGARALNVRQVRTGGDVEILPPGEARPRALSFSRDGDYLYYLNRDPESPNYSTLFQVASLGGTPRKIIFDVDSAATFSPDGKQACFKRGVLEENMEHLVIADLESREERVLHRLEAPDSFLGHPSWSPDGRHIAVGVRHIVGGARAWMIDINVESGEARKIGTRTWTGINSLGWTPGGDSIILSAFDIGAGGPQLYRLSWPEGDSSRLTSGLDGFSGVTVAGEGTSLAAMRRSRIDNLWIAPLGTNEDLVQVTSSTSSANSIILARPLAGGDIAIITPQRSGTMLVRLEKESWNRRSIASPEAFIFGLAYRENEGLFFHMVKGKEEVVAHIWRVDPDGGDPEQLTSGSGEFTVALSPSGDRLLYNTWENPGEVWVKQVPDGKPYRLSELEGRGTILVSPDGQQVLFTTLEPLEGRSYPHRHIIPIEGGEPTASFLLPPGATHIRWSPDGESLHFVDRGAGFNLFRHPVGEGEAVPVTHFEEGLILNYRWSPDSERLALGRRVGKTDSLWLLEPASGEAERITEFRTGRIRSFHWARDSKSLIIRQGTSSQDVVTISGF